VLVEGSDDAFATTPLSQPVAWAARNIWVPIASTRLAYRISINRGGSIRWLWLSRPRAATLYNGEAELGQLTRRYQLPGLTRRFGSGVQIEHAALSQSGVDVLMAGLSHACEFDRRQLGVLIAENSADVALVRLDDAPIEVTDLRYHQAPTDDRVLSLSLALEAVA
jgi:hypothetical protein